MKRIFIIMLIFVLMTPSLSFAEVQKSYDGDKVDAKSVLLDLEIIKDYKDDFIINADTFGKSLTRITGSGDYALKFFKNVDAGKNLSYGDVLTVLLDLTGYAPDVLIKSNLDRSGSVIATAKKAGISKGVSCRYDDKVLMSDYVQLIYNALTVDMQRQVSFGDTIEYKVEKDINVLSEYMDIGCIEGTVNSVNGMSLRGNYTAKADNIMIDSKIYRINKSVAAEDLIGRHVKGYVSLDDKTQLVAIAPYKNAVISVDGADISKAPSRNNSSIAYYENDKERVKRVSENADIIYNGTLIYDADEKDYISDDTVVTLIDRYDDGVIDTVLIKKYKDFYIKYLSAESKILVDEKQTVYDLTDYFEDGYNIRTASGAYIRMEDLESGNIASVLIDKNNEIKGVTVNTEKINGEVTKMRGDMKYITIAGVEYKTSEYYKNNQKAFDKVEMGMEVTCYFNALNKICDIKPYKTVKMFGYILKAKEKDGLGASVSLKIIDENNKTDTYETRDKIIYNGAKISGTDFLKKKEMLESGAFKPQLVYFKKDIENKISYIETAEQKHMLGGAGYDGLTLNYDGNIGEKIRPVSAGSSGIILASKYISNTDTKFFRINTTDDEKSYVTSGDKMTTGAAYKLSLYNISEDYHVAAAVLETAKVDTWSDYYKDSYVVSDITNELDESGDTVYAIYGYVNGVLKKVLIGNEDYTPEKRNTLLYQNTTSHANEDYYKDIKITEIPVGSVIIMNTDEKGAYSYAMQYAPIFDKDFGIFEGGDIANNYDFGVSSMLYNGNGLFSYGKVIQKTQFGLIVNSHEPTADEEGSFPISEWNRHIFAADNTPVMFYYRGTQKLQEGQMADVLKDDMICLHIFQNKIKTAVVYRD